ncbi:pseudouridine synthase [Breznakiella homolactica]|uniref:Pseudouridine synthase n=1 Tax=Breznakiella homolactica TaxID=2798577 RepID=A0A7T8B9P3_9SPIR|nr:pseudouridine synthase [Breznakiella homolactica]QQO08165.1 rRNA pseudouridine synthase [Breznakiella homolactica]
MEEPENGKNLRLQLFLARAGAASRRASEQLILDGRVSVNGERVTVLGTKVSPEDTVCLDGRRLFLEDRKHYLVLNKPPLYICSSYDPEGRRLARELLPADIQERLYNVGRLDYRSSGLILFTNDGEFAARISHPSRGIEKEYLVDSTVPVPDTVLDQFRRGVEIEGETYRCLDIERLGRKSLRIVLIEGKNREIRRVFSHFHLHPERLHRIRIGPVHIGTLQEGESRRLTGAEINELME